VRLVGVSGEGRLARGVFLTTATHKAAHRLGGGHLDDPLASGVAELVAEPDPAHNRRNRYDSLTLSGLTTMPVCSC
jgi:hypothetical protein